MRTKFRLSLAGGHLCFLVLMTLRKCISWFWNQDFDTQIPSERFKELPKKILWNTRKDLLSLRKFAFHYSGGMCAGKGTHWQASSLSRMCILWTAQLVSLEASTLTDCALCLLLSQPMKSCFLSLASTISFSPQEGEKRWAGLLKVSGFSEARTFL